MIRICKNCEESFETRVDTKVYCTRLCSHRARGNKYYNLNKEEFSERKRYYRQDNAEKYTESNSSYYQKNKIRLKNKRTLRTNEEKEVIRNRNNEYRKKNREKHLEGALLYRTFGTKTLLPLQLKQLMALSQIEKRRIKDKRIINNIMEGNTYVAYI